MKHMLSAACMALALPASGAEFEIASAVSQVVVFSEGATVTRSGDVTLPVGNHRLTFLVREQRPDIRFAGTGKLTINAVEVGNTIEKPAEKTAAFLELESRYQAVRSEFRTFQEQMEAVAARKSSAEMRMDFLRSVIAGKGRGGKGSAPLDAATLSGVLGVVDQQAVAALADISKAKTEQAALQQQEPELRDRLMRAQNAVDQARPPALKFAQMVVDVTVSKAFDGQVTSKGASEADIWWQPVYRLDLEQTGDSGVLSIKRSAVVEYDNSESWQNIDLVLSTANYFGETNVWEPTSQLRGLRDPIVVDQRLRKTRAAQAQLAPAPMPEVVADFAQDRGGRLQGQTVLFDLGSGNDLFWNIESKRFDLDTVTVPVELYGLANTMRDEIAYLYTDFTNETGGVILPGQGVLYRDGALIGEMDIPTLNPGAETSIGLGPLLGMQIKRNILNAMDGESGFITSSTELTREYETVVTSTLDYPIQVTLLDVLPTSENEDLVITMRATPRPSEQNRKGNRGVLAWDLDMAAGASKTVQFSYQMKWPKDKQLSYR